MVQQYDVWTNGPEEMPKLHLFVQTCLDDGTHYRCLQHELFLTTAIGVADGTKKCNRGQQQNIDSG